MLYKLKKHKSFIAAIEKLDTNAKKWKLLGEGSYGRAYDMRDGRVCKITTNEREAMAALKIKNSKKKYQYLYRVLDVLFLRRKGKFWRALVITPKYKKLTDGQKTELYELFCFLDFVPSFRLRSMAQIKRKLKKAVTDYYFARNAYAIVDNVISKRLKTFRKFDVLHMLRNLKSANLGPEDIHYDNILKNEDHYVLIDIAC